MECPFNSREIDTKICKHCAVNFCDMKGAGVGAVSGNKIEVKTLEK